MFTGYRLFTLVACAARGAVGCNTILSVCKRVLGPCRYYLSEFILLRRPSLTRVLLVPTSRSSYHLLFVSAVRSWEEGTSDQSSKWHSRFKKLVGSSVSVDLPYLPAWVPKVDTVLEWKKRNKLGQFRDVDEEEIKRAKEKQQLKENEEKLKAESLPVGSRCEVRVPNQPTKRGKIMFVGQTKFKSGYWVGVQYDEPLGRNDGSVDGVRYFECADKYGAFVKPQCVTAGDFPEFGIDELDEI